jgi:Ulp1 family protease
MNSDEWIVKDASSSESFPTQHDNDSCGVYVCLYSTLILKRVVLDEIYEQGYAIRQLVLHNLLQNMFFKHNHPFGFN